MQSLLRAGLVLAPRTGALTTVKRQGQQKRTCMCSPTTHPGSFRCSLHKGFSASSHAAAAPYSPNCLNVRRFAMTNSLVRIRGVEGDLVRSLDFAAAPLSSAEVLDDSGFWFKARTGDGCDGGFGWFAGFCFCFHSVVDF
ncbi:hypothetical protein Ahy_B08g091998 isoform A [Arachis hypogaea]|uniref:Uncharacterized protein n=1 Tax=Arachis hypogaea TaxID=3818 RepID=A0A444Y2W9_ARAHY|nr:hypothetical protein Ahy_B08g091998 isoform A [Arachis hypogaea]